MGLLWLLAGASAYFWLYVAVIPFHISEASFRIILPPYLQSIGTGLGMIGVLVAMFGVAALVSRLPIGLLYRRDQARWVAAGSLLGAAALAPVYTLALDPLVIGLIRAAHGFLIGAASTLHLALFLEARPANVDRGRANGLYAATTTTAYIIGNFEAGWVADTFGYAAAFNIAGASSLVAALVTLLIRLPRDDPGAAVFPAPSGVPRPPLPQKEGEPAAEAASMRVRSRAIPRWPAGMMPLMRNRGVRQTCLASLVTNIVVDMTWNFVPLWGVAVGHNLATVGGVRSAGNIAGLFSRAAAGEIGRLTGWGVMSAGSIIVLSVVVIALPASTALVYFGAIVAAVATIRGMTSVANTVVLMEETDADPGMRGMGSAVVSMSRDLGTILGPMIGGFVAAGVGLENMFRLVPIPAIILYVPLLFHELALRREERSRVAS